MSQTSHPLQCATLIVPRAWVAPRQWALTDPSLGAHPSAAPYYAAAGPRFRRRGQTVRLWLLAEEDVAEELKEVLRERLGEDVSGHRGCRLE